MQSLAILFQQTLEEISRSPETRENTIGAGGVSCRYSELPALLDKTEADLARHGIGLGTCTAVECPNTLPGTLLLLSLLRRGNSVIVAPPSLDGNETKPVPHFCRHRVKVRAAPAKAGDAGTADALPIETNTQYNGAAVPPARFYLRTSGSMGATKIVSHDHATLIGNARNVMAKYNITAKSRVAIPVPIAHMYGFGAAFLSAFLAGASIDLQEKTNLLKYLDREKRFEPDIVFSTPALCEMLLKGFKSARTGYRAFVASGQRIGEPLFRAFDPMVGGALINQYGSTEMGATSACEPGDSLERRVHTIGEPMPGVDLKIEDGLLYCRHPFGFQGYLDEAGEWLHRQQPGAWYRTGDTAQVSSEGAICVLGRADASVNRNGYLVQLADIERMMEKIEAAGEVAVVPGRSDTKLGQRIVAFCVLRPGSVMDGVELRRRCSGIMPVYAVPDEVRVMDQLPLLESGKVDRQALSGLAGQKRMGGSERQDD